MTPKEFMIRFSKSALRGFRKTKYWNCYSDFGNGKIVYDKDVANFVKKHLRIRDRFDLRKFVEATLLAADILGGATEEPKDKSWKFDW